MKRVLAIKVASPGFAATVVLALGLSAAWPVSAQSAKTSYPSMAPVVQYMMASREAEMALARSAAPESISGDAEVLVLGSHAYETAAKGKNGFVCMVLRSWTAGIDDPDFWNPKVRAPICFNAPAARTYVPFVTKKTEWILAGRSKAEMFESVKAGLDKGELPTQEIGAMCYMLSKDGYLGDPVQHWHPHVMFFLPQMKAEAWGAGLKGSPILAGLDPEDRLTVFLIPVGKWSDGTPDAGAGH
jgi:hypothetical protein